MDPQEFEREQERRQLMAINVVMLGLLVAIVWFFWSKPGHAEEPDTALWLARSCIGEAGFNAHQTGECAAIWHVYRKRSELTGWTVYRVARKYSAAIKPGKQKNKWVLYLDRDGNRPKHWPAAKWDLYRDDWMATLEHVEGFMKGEVSDPAPDAMHYGSTIDAHRAIRAGWKLIKTKFRNQFWRVK
jgi:hypothetical protein